MGVVSIFTDGAARGNPDGPGGYGTILQYTDKEGTLHEKELSQGYLRTTNNRMELMAAIAGLEALNRPCLIDLYSDSKYLVDARGKSGPVKNIDLWKRLLSAMEPHKVRFIWVKGHAGHPENERCDRLAVKAATSRNLIPDEGLAED